jgi:hypothetical protein
MDRQKEQKIRERAYRIWEEKGRPKGRGKEHWERARAEIEEEEAMTRGDQELKND